MDDLDLYNETKSELFNHCAQDLDKHLTESELYDLWLVATSPCRYRIAEVEYDRQGWRFWTFAFMFLMILHWLF